MKRSAKHCACDTPAPFCALIGDAVSYRDVLKEMSMNANGVRIRFQFILLACCLALSSPPASAAWGELDPSFGAGGAAFVDFPGHGPSYVYAMAVDQNGNIYLAGESYTSSTYWDFAIAKFDALGNPATGFGDDGRVVLDLGNTDDDFAYSVAIGLDGAIYVGGDGVTLSTYDMVVVKLDADGRPATGFGNDGVARIAVPEANGVVNSIAVDVAGNVYAGGDNTRDGSIDFAVAKLDANGTLVGGFGSNGLATIDLGSGSADHARGLLIDSDGNLYLGGDGDVGGSYAFAVIKLDSDGGLVGDFGVDGKAIHRGGTGSDDYGYALARDADGNIYLAGSTNAAGSASFAVQKLDMRGDLVAPFGSNGLQLIDLGAGSTGSAHSLAIDAAGNLLLAGRRTIGTQYSVAVAAFDANGRLLPDFGGAGSGLAIFDLDNTVHDAYGVAVDAGGRVIVGCDAYLQDSMHFGALRLQGSSIADRIYANGFDPS